MITVEGTIIKAETNTLTAMIDRGFLTSLRSKLDGEEYLQRVDPRGSALQLLYPGHGTTDVIGNLAATVSGHQLSPQSAQLRFSGWEADGVVTVTECPETGDLLIEPSAYSSRPGALSC